LNKYHPKIYQIAFPSVFGAIKLLWKKSNADAKIIRVFLPRENAGSNASTTTSYSPFESASCEMVDEIIANLLRYLNGEAIVFSLDAIDLEVCREFQKKVLRAEHGIPRGFVSTYGRIAAHLGKPGGAQAVGRALATNPFPLIIPCHRAIGADGSLSGFQGGQNMKRALLEMEGIRFTARGKVVLDTVHY
jgi:methylated-DNA-[protein]-cysteine S-methyltransferase